ncbi:hypothetical protein D9M71_546890 [compost metagenome]
MSAHIHRQTRWMSTSGPHHPESRGHKIQIPCSDFNAASLDVDSAVSPPHRRTVNGVGTGPDELNMKIDAGQEICRAIDMGYPAEGKVIWPEIRR